MHLAELVRHGFARAETDSASNDFLTLVFRGRNWASMVSNRFITLVFRQAGQDWNAPPPRHGGNPPAGSARLGIITVMAIIAGTFQSAALGQPPDPFLNQGMPPQAAVSYPPPAFAANAPLLAQNVPAQGTDLAQLSGGTAAVKPEEKKEGEKSDSDEKKDDKDNATPPSWNFHAQTTAVAQGDPGFPAQYSGPNSLNSAGERQGTLAVDLFAGMRLWQGAEVHGDFLMWQGYGLSNTFGIEDFPNGDAYKAGTTIPNFTRCALVSSSDLRLRRGTGGRARRPVDACGQTGHFAADHHRRPAQPPGHFRQQHLRARPAHAVHELGGNHQPHVGLRGGSRSDTPPESPWNTISQTGPCATDSSKMPSMQNGFTADDRIFTWPGQGGDGPFFLSWGMVTELERRWKIDGHPGAIRFLVLAQRS